MIHETIVVGPFQCNCVILACGETKKGVLIDPGDEAANIVAKVKSLGVEIQFILHTHAHLDHIGATAGVKENFAGAPACLHKDDELLYNNLPMQGQMFGLDLGSAPKLDKYLEDGEVLTFGNQRLEVLHTPGHSPGSICLKLQTDDERVFSGDTLFNQSVGRTDLWGGSHEQMIRSIKNRLLTLNGDTLVYPGHGPHTRVGVEKSTNPFLV